MVKTIFEISERENRILENIRGRHGFHTREQAFIFVIQEHEQNLEPQLRPEYIKKLIKIEEEEGIPFSDIQELRKLTGE